MSSFQHLARRAGLGVMLIAIHSWAFAGGPAETTRFEFTDFNEITVFSVFNLAVSQGDDFLVEVTIDADAVDRLDVTQTGSRLRIGLMPGDSDNLQTIQGTVTMPVLNRIELDGVVNVTLDGFVQDQMTIELADVSTLTGEALSLGSLDATVSGVSQLDLGNVSPIGEADIDIEGVSQATLNMDVGASLAGSVSGTSSLSYFGTDVVLDVTVGFGSTLQRLGDTQAEGVGFRINSGLSGAWFNPDTSGQGFLIEVLPDRSTVFLAWFTYTTDASGAKVVGDPGHRWLTASGDFAGDTATLDVVLTQGGQFDDPDLAVTNSPPGSYGSITLTFSDCSNGQVDYDLTQVQLSGTIPVVRIADDNVSLCEQLKGGARPAFTIR
ncbi:MAG: DUF2807 domain-containing protein [Xanthomonadales bacterium]|nr:DUF2807 domain-containing protein [Xanthomonadales bacterium]